MGHSATMVRAATVRDLQPVFALLCEAIDTSPYYCDRFKVHEKERLGPAYLRALIAVDPWHVMLVTQSSQIAGFVITMPEFGTLWSPWIYVAPSFRTRAAGMHICRETIRHWENGAFHKMACFARPENHTAIAIFEYFGFSKIALLKQHIFGQDVWLMERPLNKVTEGYDNGVSTSRMQLLRLKLGDAFTRRTRDRTPGEDPASRRH